MYYTIHNGRKNYETFIQLNQSTNIYVTLCISVNTKVLRTRMEVERKKQWLVGGCNWLSVIRIELIGNQCRILPTTLLKPSKRYTVFVFNRMEIIIFPPFITIKNYFNRSILSMYLVIRFSLNMFLFCLCSKVIATTNI